MFTFLKRLLWDETAFVGYARAALLGLVGLQAAGTLALPSWLTIAAAVAAGFMRSSSMPGASPQSPNVE